MSRTRRLLIVLAAALLGCQVRPRVSTMSADDVAHEVSVERSPSKHLTTYSGMMLGSDSIAGGVAMQYNLRSFLQEGQHHPTHQLFVARKYEASRFWNYARARDAAGSSLTTTVLRRDFDNCVQVLGQCTYAENLAIDLPDDLMRASATNGLQVRVAGETGRGEFEVDVPAPYVQGQMKALAADAGS
jgi:hypothetical protein